MLLSSILLTHSLQITILSRANTNQVVSPFQSILDYELSLGIPPGWVNYSISRTAPSGFWHRLETGSIPMDAGFFEGFNRDLHDPARWEAFYQAQRARRDPSLPPLPKETPPVPQLDGEWLFHDMMTAARAPDPWMYPALKALKASGRYVVAALSNTVIFPPRATSTRRGRRVTTSLTTRSGACLTCLCRRPTSGCGSRTPGSTGLRWSGWTSSRGRMRGRIGAARWGGRRGSSRVRLCFWMISARI